MVRPYKLRISEKEWGGKLCCWCIAGKHGKCDGRAEQRSCNCICWRDPELRKVIHGK